MAFKKSMKTNDGAAQRIREGGNKSMSSRWSSWLVACRLKNVLYPCLVRVAKRKCSRIVRLHMHNWSGDLQQQVRKGKRQERQNRNNQY